MTDQGGATGMCLHPPSIPLQRLPVKVIEVSPIPKAGLMLDWIAPIHHFAQKWYLYRSEIICISGTKKTGFI